MWEWYKPVVGRWQSLDEFLRGDSFIAMLRFAPLRVFLHFSEPWASLLRLKEARGPVRLPRFDCSKNTFNNSMFLVSQRGSRGIRRLATRFGRYCWKSALMPLRL